ncbi:exopolysaccharide biosynthesis protein [Clostridium sp. A1-XYC3]|uniref:protein-tyrosine-phosphatase n=1 Tax=Clostridium tanneri TaxID=3037988 RepID=A0ABU4JWP5_9CLOT|nr:CpsB/CapC family capsule biosynthesis tyrosine phosphatase [Clostridium sp. A1-XYC3]MDW8802590.1 exopolysaccharide biosynthesis protein [Clostridium sp. A1-XYC3]
MIDIHSHILPGIDDGAKTLDDTIEMLKIARNNGIKKIIATPHFYRGYYENKFEDICKLTEEISGKVKEQGLDIEIIFGQEIFLDNHTLDHYKEGIIKGINNTKYMLIEFPMQDMPKNALDTMYELRLQGIVPVVAHPERYSYIIEKPSVINNFIEEGCLFQINSGSIEGHFGKRVQKTSEILISHGICHFIGSDAHSVNRRSPKIKNALDIAGKLSNGMDKSVMENVELLLNNEEIKKKPEKIKEKKSIFDFLKRKVK